jgi:nucleoside-diphosphate-sugar epimerase
VNFAITGANGFLGVHIIHHLLNSGHSVKAVIRPNASLDEFELIKKRYALLEEIYSNLSWHVCELFDVVGLEQAFYGVDYVVHLAGKISYLKKDLPSLLQINQEYTSNVVNVALSLKVKKLLYCSSIAAISKNSKNEAITEDTEWDDEIAHSNYGFTKHLGECELWRGREEGLATVAINPGIILGYGDWTKGSNKLFGNAQKGFPFYSNGITGWVGVRDVARIVERLCLSDISGERFIIVSENKSFKDIADTMTDALGTKKPSIEIKGLLYKVAYGIVLVKEFLGLGGMLSRETVRASVSVNRFDNSKVKEALDYDFESIKEVIHDSV